MKGIEHAIGFIAGLLMVLIVIVVVYFIIALAQRSSAQPLSDSYIYRLCPEWRLDYCNFDSANSIAISVNNVNKYLSQLCSKKYTNSEDNWDTVVWEKCKTMCCGNTTS